MTKYFGAMVLNNLALKMRCLDQGPSYIFLIIRELVDQFGKKLLCLFKSFLVNCFNLDIFYDVNYISFEYAKQVICFLYFCVWKTWRSIIDKLKTKTVGIAITYSWKDVHPLCASLTGEITPRHESLCSYRESYMKSRLILTI